MSRVDRAEVVLDTSQFTPGQLQPRFLLTCAMRGWAGWARANLAPFRALIGEWQFGLVVIGVAIAWEEPLSFFDTDVLEATTAIRVRPDGELLAGDVRFIAAGAEVARVLATMRPIRITDSSLAASPAALPDGLLQRFEPDEIVQPPTRPRLADRINEVHTRGRYLGEATHDFRIRRADTEVADQWSFVEVPAHAAAAREEMIISGRHPNLAGTLARPLLDLDAEISRPLYVFDAARVATEAYEIEGVLTFVHRIESDAAGGHTHATIIERLGAA